MPPSIPKQPVPVVPAATAGRIYENVGKYARGAVLYAFERIGGAEELASWARNNPDEFYTKLFPKIITREVEVSDTRGVDELLDVLDGEYTVREEAPCAPDEEEGLPWGVEDMVVFED